MYGTQVAILAGAGDNGGDALYAGARLAGRGAAVTAVLLSPDRAHRGGLAALRAAGGRRCRPTRATRRTWWPRRGWCWTGSSGSAGRAGCGRRRPALVRAVTGAVVAVDLPSGVDADTGAVEGEAVRADVTVTFGAVKPGLLVGAGAEHAGEVRLVGIGLDLPVPELRVLDPADVVRLLPRPGPRDDKYTRGVVGVAAGSSTYPGAGVLSTGSAVHGGAGMVRYAGGAAEHVRSRWPEAIVTEGKPSEAGRVQAWVVGPGIGTDDAAAGAAARRARPGRAGARRRRRPDPAGPGARAGPVPDARRPCSPRTTGSSSGSPGRSGRTGWAPPAGPRPSSA